MFARIRQHGLVPAVALVCLLLLASASSAHSTEMADPLDGVVKLQVITYQGIRRVGSGFLVRLDEDRAYILTAAHVVEGAKQTGVVFNARRLDAPVQGIVVGPEHWDRRGLALVVVPASAAYSAGARPLPLSSERAPEEGRELRLIGNPRTVGDWSSLYGRVARREGKVVKIQAAVNEGSSGGPALQDGQVVGVVVEEISGIAVIVPVAVIRTYLDGYKVMPGVVGAIQPSLPPKEASQAIEPSAKLTVRSNVTGDTVLIDGKRHGPTRLDVELPGGSHLVRVEKEGYEPFEERVELGSDGEKTLWAKLQPVGPKPGETFRDCSVCPEMVVIPAGSFQMGSPDDEKGRNSDEGPEHKVRINEPFALGKREVTVGEFRAFVAATGYRTEAEQGQGCAVLDSAKWRYGAKRNWRAPGFPQGDDHPVVCVSWNDARAYLKWLSAKANQNYRLPSEAEWEYAARARTTTARFWGEHSDQACQYANVADEALKRQYNWRTIHDCDDGHVNTAPVGSYKSNAFGLKDILGNVWEWTDDCYNDSYDGAPSDGSAWSKGDCGRRVLRGGSWGSTPDVVRLALRSRHVTEDRDDVLGFRPARTL
jgi:formylglycine-generating enzyme required for sulfatase activity